MFFGLIMLRNIEYLIAEKKFHNYILVAKKRIDLFKIFKEKDEIYIQFIVCLDHLEKMMKLESKEIEDDIELILLNWINQEIIHNKEMFVPIYV